MIVMVTAIMVSDVVGYTDGESSNNDANNDGY